jgi:C4-dicarboxylate transporter, DctM subunit
MDQRDPPGERTVVESVTRPGIGGGPANIGGTAAGRALFGGLVLVAIALIWNMLRDVPNQTVGASSLGVMLVLIFLRVPVGIAMIVPSALGIWVLVGWPGLSRSLMEIPFATVSGWSLSVLPMFIFMGVMLWRSGITTRVYDAARAWLGWLPGGLAVTTNFAGAGLAAASGSTIGITYALGRIGVPEMLRAGYDRRLATASVLMAGTGGQLIPPSILLVVYAGVAQTPVGPQLLAGLVPGLLLAGSYGVMIVLLAVLVPRLAPKMRTGGVTWGARWRAVASIWPLPVLVFTVIGGLYAGVFTATEAGAFGALGASLLGLWYIGPRRMMSSLRLVLRDTVSSVGSIFLLLIGAVFLNRLMALSGAASWMARTVEQMELGRL